MTCTQHTACQLPTPLRVEHVEVATKVSEHTGESFGVLRYQGHQLASFVDRGFAKHASHGGGWFTRWEAFMGGNAVYLPRHVETGEMELVVAHLVDEVNRVSFHTRMAMH